MGRSKSVKVARAATLKTSLNVDLDSKGQFFMKCHPMFRRELNFMLKEIEKLSRTIVAKENTKYSKKGNLRRSIHKQPIKTQPGGQRIYGTVTAGSSRAPYARYVHNGTEPHEIWPNTKEQLSFEWKFRRGRVVTHRMEQVNKFGPGVKIRGRGDEARTYWRRKARWTVGPIKNRSVVVPMVFHPGYDGNPFLNIAASLVGARYGATVKIPPGKRLRVSNTSRVEGVIPLN